MKFLKFPALVATLCVVTSLAAAETKVGYVDIDRITSKAKPVNTMMSDIEDKIKTLQEDIDGRRQKITSLQADLKRVEGVVSKEEQEKKLKEIDRLKNELDELETQARRHMREVDSTIFEPMLKKILFAIQDIAKEQDFDIILRGEAVLYGSSAVDLSDAVIERLNDEKSATKESSSASDKQEKKADKPAEEDDNTGAILPSISNGSGKQPDSKSPTKVRPVDRQSD